MIFDVSDFLGCWSRPVTISVVRTFKVDFEEIEECTDLTIQAVIQPARMEDLKIDSVDYSKKYIMIHSDSEIQVNNRVKFNGDDYRIISKGNYNGYGFYEAVGEEIK